jgi:hypothetical protein
MPPWTTSEAELGYPQKIVTCCYCGTRAALVLKGKTRHELTCASCGAPLHDLKMLPKQRSGQREVVNRTAPRGAKPPKQRPKRKFRNRRKGLLKKAFEEAFDLIEDIFD